MGGVKLQKQRLYANSCLQRLEQIPEGDFDNIQVLLDEYMCIWCHESLLIKEKIHECPKDISLRSIFRSFLWEKKKVIDFFNNFLYFLESNIKVFLK